MTPDEIAAQNLPYSHPPAGDTLNPMQAQTPNKPNLSATQKVMV